MEPGPTARGHLAVAWGDADAIRPDKSSRMPKVKRNRRMANLLPRRAWGRGAAREWDEAKVAAWDEEVEEAAGEVKAASRNVQTVSGLGIGPVCR